MHLLNKLYALERSRQLGTKPALLKGEESLKLLRTIVEKLGWLETELDYDDFLKYAIKTSSNPKHEKFPPLSKLVNKVKQFQLVVQNGEVYKYIFWPSLTKNTGKIYDQEKDTYYGFYTQDLLKSLLPATQYHRVINELLTPYKEGKLETITREQLLNLELVLVSMIRYRESWALFIKTFYKLWKYAKGLPIVEKQFTPKKDDKKEEKIYEVD